jgi:hypothetical protein
LGAALKSNSAYLALLCTVFVAVFPTAAVPQTDAVAAAQRALPAALIRQVDTIPDYDQLLLCDEAFRLDKTRLPKPGDPGFTQEPSTDTVRRLCFKRADRIATPATSKIIWTFRRDKAAVTKFARYCHLLLQTAYSGCGV